MRAEIVFLIAGTVNITITGITDPVINNYLDLKYIFGPLALLCFILGTICLVNRK